jgi:hypothetical protein
MGIWIVEVASNMFYHDETWKQEYFTNDPKLQEFIGVSASTTWWINFPQCCNYLNYFGPSTFYRTF